MVPIWQHLVYACSFCFDEANDGCEMHRRDGQLVEIIVLNQILANASLLTILFMLRDVETSRLAHLKERKCSTTNTRSNGMVERSIILSTVFDFLLINEVILVCSNDMMLTTGVERQELGDLFRN